MWIRKDIAVAVERIDAEASELSGEEVDALSVKLYRAFAAPGMGPLWERQKHAASMQEREGWRSLPSFDTGPALLFVEDAQGSCAFNFKRMSDLVRVVSECPGFEFYVADEACSYLVGFNHHDFVIGSGSAETWIQKLLEAELRN